MRPVAGCAGHWARYRAHDTAKLVCPLGHGHSARAGSGFHDRRRSRERGFDPSPREEHAASRERPRWKLGDEQTEIADTFQQLAMRGRVRAVDTSGKHGNGMATAGECGTVNRCVDP